MKASLLRIVFGVNLFITLLASNCLSQTTGALRVAVGFDPAPDDLLAAIRTTGELRGILAW